MGLNLEERLRAMEACALPGRLWAWHYYASEADKARLFHPDVAAAAHNSLRHFPVGGDGPWTPRQTIAQDRGMYFPQEMLRKADRMSMARSVEARVPCAAPEVLALSGRLSYRQMVRGGELKWALRRAFEDALPPEVVSRPKHGLTCPWTTGCAANGPTWWTSAWGRARALRAKALCARMRRTPPARCWPTRSACAATRSFPSSP